MAIVTLQEVKTQIGMSANVVTDDARLELYRKAAEQFVKTYCRQDFEKKTKTESWKGGASVYYLTNVPILSVGSILVDGVLITPNEYELSYDGLSVSLHCNTSRGSIVNFTYTAGYDQDSMPSDLKLATLWAAEWFYLHQNRGDMGRTQVGKNGEGISILASIPPMILQVLDSYKRLDFGIDRL